MSPIDQETNDVERLGDDTIHANGPMNNQTVKQSHVDRHKWRYTCPVCHSVQLMRRRTYGKERTRGSHPAAGPLYCHACKQSRDTAFDKKIDETVSVIG